MPTHRASVVIPCYNHGRFVREAVDSALRQQDAQIDVVVIDDGSDDGLTPQACDACASDRVRVIHQPNAGLPEARNVGVRATDAPLIAFLDADDWLEPWFVKDLAEAIEREGGVDGGQDVSHAYGQQRLAELGHGTWRVPDWDPLLMMITNIHPPCTLVRRSAWEAVGGFDPTMRDGYEDWDFWLRLIERGYRGVRVRHPVYVWRRHSPQTMIDHAVAMHEELVRRITAAHKDLYARHATELIVRMSVMLRDANANWIDENHEPIVIRDMKRLIERQQKDSAAMLDQVRQLQGDLATTRQTLDQTVRAYESKPSVRLSRRIHGAIEKLPGPLAGAGRTLARLTKRLVAPPRGP